MLPGALLSPEPPSALSATPLVRLPSEAPLMLLAAAPFVPSELAALAPPVPSAEFAELPARAISDEESVRPPAEGPVDVPLPPVAPLRDTSAAPLSLPGGSITALPPTQAPPVDSTASNASEDRSIFRRRRLIITGCSGSLLGRSTGVHGLQCSSRFKRRQRFGIRLADRRLNGTLSHVTAFFCRNENSDFAG
jgi:hypothetical protein